MDRGAERQKAEWEQHIFGDAGCKETDNEGRSLRKKGGTLERNGKLREQDSREAAEKIAF